MSPTTGSLTKEQLDELLRHERAKGNPLALFAGSCIDPNDPEDRAFWEGVRECRRQAELQMAEMEAREAGEKQK